jgi:hypothetical protein
MINKILIIIVLGFCFNFLTISIYSCRCSIDESRKCSLIKKINIIAVDNGGLDERPIINNTVYAKALILRVNIEESVSVCKNRTNWLPINTATAMCKKEYIEQRFQLKSTKIISDKVFDAAHPSGSDLKGLFTIKGDSYYLMHSPDDTSSSYVFTLEKVYRNRGALNDTVFSASTTPLKLKK